MEEFHSEEDIIKAIREGRSALEILHVIKRSESFAEKVKELPEYKETDFELTGPEILFSYYVLKNIPLTLELSRTLQRYYYKLAGTSSLLQSPFFDQFSFSYLKELTLSQAQFISAVSGERILLNGLTSLDSSQAKELAKFKRSLYLNGLKKLDISIAKELAQFKGDLLKLDGLTQIDAEIAKELAQSGEITSMLSLNGLSQIDANVAKELAQFEGNHLELNGLTQIDVTIAKELALFEGELLSLNGLKKLAPSIAKELAQFEEKNSMLFLNGLSQIDTNVAKELAQFEGNHLELNGLTSLDLRTTKELSQFGKSSHEELRKAGRNAPFLN